jgi:hypothetical protein
MIQSTVTRWTLVVGSATERDLRQFLDAEGGKKGDLSKFVEEAVKARIFHVSAVRAKELNENVSDGDLQDADDEAIDWARRR